MYNKYIFIRDMSSQKHQKRLEGEAAWKMGQVGLWLLVVGEGRLFLVEIKGKIMEERKFKTYSGISTRHSTQLSQCLT